MCNALDASENHRSNEYHQGNPHHPVRDAESAIHSVSNRISLDGIADAKARDPTKYRDAAEEEMWRERDPLTRVQEYLRHRGQWSEEWEHELLETCTAEVEDAMNEAEATPQPPPQDMFRYMYAAMPPALQEQEAALLNTLQQKG